MCGIAGIVGRVNDTNRAALGRMSAAMVHRGPDGDGTWESPPDERGEGVLLAHRRLAILDLSPAGAQPMIDPVSGHALVFNGEIYNFQDLRARLLAAGHRFESTGDTAVMLRALGTEGPGSIASLRGMFAFASWDPSRRRLLLARDPLGIKPLYFARRNHGGGEWSLAFASEVRALLASGLLGQPRLDPVAAASVVWNGFVAGPHTAVLGVESLWPGQLRIFDARGAEQESRRFWSVPAPGAFGVLDEDRLSAALEECVRLHLVSDVPLGVFLSGGIDSSVVANLAQKANRGPVHTFTLAFEEGEFNEGPDARRIARAIGTEHREVVLREKEFVGRAGQGARQPGPAHLRRPQLLLHVARRPQGRLHRRAGGHRRRRALRRLHLVPRSPAALALVAAAGLDAARIAGRRGPVRRGAPAALAARCRRRSAGPSCPRWCGAETTSSRSTSLPTRSSCPTSSPP